MRDEILCDSCKYFQNKTCPSLPGANIQYCIDYEEAIKPFELEDSSND